MNVQSAVTSSRFYFVDLLCGWAVLIMIETHVVNALLQDTYKAQAFFSVLSFFNGLVAPTFLFCAGFAVAIQLHRRWEKFIQLHSTFWRYLVRMLFILIVGYSLHIPVFSFRRLLTLQDERLWQLFYQSDILHIISLTLIFIVIIAVLLRTEKRLTVFSILLGLIIIFISPIIREMDHTALPIWFRSYLTTQFKSQFPIFPCSASVISGMLLGFCFLRIKENDRDGRLMPRLALIAFGGIVISLLMEILPVSVYPNHDFWRASPKFFFVRLGIVILLCVGLWWYEQKRITSSKSVVALFG